MAIPEGLTARQLAAYKESTDVAGQTALTVINPDGSNVGSNEFQAAASLADATANPTTTGVAAYNELFNGTTWDRQRSGVTTASSTFTGKANTLPEAIYNTSKPTLTNGQSVMAQCNVNGARDVNEVLAPQYEDNTIGVAKVEQRYSYGRVTADGQIKNGSGFIHSVTFAATGTVTAGVITLYDNTAESGTIVWSGTIQVGLNPTTIILNVSVSTGIYVGYDGTIANVATTVAYR